MGQRVIPVAVTAEYIGGDGVTLGAAGSHNSVLIEYDFRSAGPQWDDISGRYVLWTNPQGNSTNRINLGVSEKVDGYEGVYQAAPPADAMCVPGWAEMVVVGFTMDGDKEVTKIKTEPSRFRVLPGSSRAADNEGVAPTVADQLQAEIEAVNDRKVNKPDTPYDENGTAGQVLETLGNGRTRWRDETIVTPEVVYEVLRDHQDWVTTVQDGSITARKIVDGAITEAKLADNAVSDEKLSVSLRETIHGLHNMTFMDKAVAHRGYANADNIYTQDDSQAAFAAAGVAGFGAIECDPKKDANGRIVMIHDAVNRISWHSGTDIRLLDSTQVFYKTKAGTKTNVPLCSLEDVIFIAKMFGMMVFFDMGEGVCSVEELVNACETAGFYRFAFFGLQNDTELLNAPDYAVKILGGYSFNPSREQLAAWAETYQGKNFGVRTQQASTTAEEIAWIQSYGFLNFLNVTDAKTMDPAVRNAADYILCDDLPFLEGGNTTLHGAYARMYGAVNLLENTLQNVTRNGLTYTIDNRGTVLISGTFQNNGGNDILRVGAVTLQPGEYILSGTGTSGQNVYSDTGDPGIKLQALISSEPVAFVWDRGPGGKIELETQTEVTIRIHIDAGIAEGRTVTGLRLEPMVRESSVVSDAFAPYAMTNRQLTDAVKAIAGRVAALEG